MAKRIYKGSAKSKEERQMMRGFNEKIWNHIRAAQYEKAFYCAKEAYERYPRNRFAQYDYAVALGDCEEWAPKTQQEVNRKRAVRLLRALLLRTSGIDPRMVSSWRNEYYWFSRQPYKQYLLGCKRTDLGDKFGNYSIGVGAAMLALKSAPTKIKIAESWARKSISAWERYFKVVPNYYNSYVWYAKALGLSGDLDAMEKALKKAAKLSGRPLSYQEFRDTRKEVLAALAKAESKTKRK